MCDWRKQKEKLETLPSKKQGLPGAGRKPKLPVIEEQLAAWIEHQRLRVTRTMIQQKALQLESWAQGIFSEQGVSVTVVYLVHVKHLIDD